MTKEKIIWILSGVTLFVISIIITSMWLYGQACCGGTHLNSFQKKIILNIGQLPGNTKAAVVQLKRDFSDEPDALLRLKSDVVTTNWSEIFPSKIDKGFLLLSGVDANSKSSYVKLQRISDGKIVAQWLPDWASILKLTTSKQHGIKRTIKNVQAVHTVLLPTGDIIFNTGFALVRLNFCQREPAWVLDSVFHHSIELDGNGGIWVPSVSDKTFVGNEQLKRNVRFDSLAHVSVDGRILSNTSFGKVLMDNGLRGILFGAANGGFPNFDPLHINQISIAESDSEFWNKDDLLVSSRHLSTIFIYRPSTGKIIWYKQGSWLNQHSTRFLGSNSISMFDNNIYAVEPIDDPFLTPGDSNQFIVYDLKSKRELFPHRDQISKAALRTVTGGYLRVLDDGSVVMLESEKGRIVRVGASGIIWSRINSYDDTRIGATDVRYLTADEAHLALNAFAITNCAGQQLSARN